MSTPIHPMLALFLKLTALVAIGIVALIIAGFLLKIVVVAAVIAAVVIGAFFVYAIFRRRSSAPVIR